MQFSGAVEATKTLRARDKSIDQRADVARQIVDGSASVMLPRRHFVVLEWIFDMLATDSVAYKSAELWKLLSQLWISVSDNGRRRIYRNHRFVVNLSAVFPQVADVALTEAIAQALESVGATIDLLAFSSDSQAGQLVLAYLKSSTARANERISSIIFDAARARTHIFGVKTDSSALDSLLCEPSQARRLHYLTDYFSEPKNTAVATSDLNIENVMQSVCESGMEIQLRFDEISSAYPQWASRLLEVLVELKPREASPQLLEKVVERSLHSVNGGPDWDVMELCMHIDAAPALKHMQSLIEAEPTDHVLALMISRSAALRSLPEFLSQWKPRTKPSQVVITSLTRALGSLSPIQVASLLEPTSQILELIVTSLGYKAAGSPKVKEALQNLLNSSEVDVKVKLAVLQIAPGLSVVVTADQRKTKDIMMNLRVSELENTPVDLKSIVKKIDTEKDASSVILRFYPMLEQANDARKYLVRLLVKCGPAVRLQLSRMWGVFEQPTLADALIETLIDMGELDALLNIPRSVLAWNQRHRIVDMALKHRGVAMAAELVIRLIDGANPPEVKLLAPFLSSISADGVQTFIRILKPVMRHREYVEQLLSHPGIIEWQTNCILALSGERPADCLKWVQSNHGKSELRIPVLEVLSRLPSSPDASQIVERLAVELRADPPELLFELLCRRRYHWSIITALFAYSGCRFTGPYTNFCRELCESERDCLVMAAADEGQYGVLQCLAAGRMIHGAKHANALTAVLVRCHFGGDEVTSELVGLCEMVLRDQLNVLTPFALEVVVAVIAKVGRTGQLWEEVSVVLSHVLLLQRRWMRGRMHLIIGALTSLLEGADSVERAGLYVRVVNNLCNPPQHYLGGAATREELNSAAARDHRYVAKSLGVLLQNYVFVVLATQRGVKETTEVNAALRPAAYAMMDVLGGENVRSVAAGLDSSSRAYLRAVYEDYAQNVRWTSD